MTSFVDTAPDGTKSLGKLSFTVMSFATGNSVSRVKDTYTVVYEIGLKITR